MKTQEILNPQRWAETTFGLTQLKDIRRTRRAVGRAARQAAEKMLQQPVVSSHNYLGRGNPRIADAVSTPSESQHEQLSLFGPENVIDAATVDKKSIR